ncbi:17189_t:CDS:2 [Cetraspora pellucida]|uniref:17189_t:CDS:1 n=1 Tax=Cetraspora pellucida TaxID=1433469 RepID=A0ACA9LCI5_9GLOM|nr:17189_t:CDS:2 [Cetraspora pellucida]
MYNEILLNVILDCKQSLKEKNVIQLEEKSYLKSVATSTYLTVNSKPSESNKCLLKVSLVETPQGKTAEIKNTDNCMIKVLMTDHARESLIFVVGQMKVIDNKFYVNAKDINYINVKKKNSEADDSQISLTSTNSTRSKLLNIHQNIIKNLRDTSTVQSSPPSNIGSTFLTKHKRTNMTDNAIVDADFATSVDRDLKNTEISLKSDQVEFEKITKNSKQQKKTKQLLIRSFH